MGMQSSEEDFMQVDAVGTLTRLGLTFNQARTFIALVKLELASAEAVSKTAKIARQDIYRVMPTLEKIGLVEEIIAIPTIFKPLPLMDALKILIERRNRETADLLVKAEEIGKNFKGTTIVSTGEGHQFVLVPCKEALLRKIRRMTENAQKSISLMIPTKRFLPWLFKNLDILEKAIRRNVSIRIITERSEEEQLLMDSAQSLIKEACFEIRYATTPIATCFGINDEQEILVSTSTETGPLESPALWSNNSSLIELGKKCFEQTWKISKPYGSKR